MGRNGLISILTRLVQLTHSEEGRRAALIDNSQLHLLATYRSLYQFVWAALQTGMPLRDLLSTDLSGIALDYDEVYALGTPWRFLPAFDHPRSPGCCLISRFSDSGWQYQRSGESLAAHGQPLFAADSQSVIHAPELAAIYIVAGDRAPRRVGMAGGICAARYSALGPELVLEPDLTQGKGSACLARAGREIWSASADTDRVLDALETAEAEHFHRAGNRTPGDVHVVFFGGKLQRNCAAVQQNDEAGVKWEALGRPLRVIIQQDSAPPQPIVLGL